MGKNRIHVPRETSFDPLKWARDHGLPVKELVADTHFRITLRNTLESGQSLWVDYWPTTGTWMQQNDQSGGKKDLLVLAAILQGHKLSPIPEFKPYTPPTPPRATNLPAPKVKSLQELPQPISKSQVMSEIKAMGALHSVVAKMLRTVLEEAGEKRQRLKRQANQFLRGGAEVTDHALLRYLERVAGIDLEALRKQVAKEAEHPCTDAHIVKRGRVMYVKRDRMVLTVLVEPMQPTGGVDNVIGPIFDMED